MNPETEIKEVEIFESEDQIDEIDGDNSPSVDEFLMELEAKEKDLHITSDLEIEVADSDVDESVPDFVKTEPTVTGNSGEPIAGNAKSAGLKTRVYELEQELESMKNKIIALRMERNDVQEKSDRRVKDFESYKYRMDRERRGAVITQIGNLATQMLPVLDNLDRALDSIKDVPEGKLQEFRQFFDGIALVHQQINDVFSNMGVQPIVTVGETFDPHFHEAVSTEDNSDLPPNTVAAEMLRGYRIGNLVIRHSMVRVTAGFPVSRTAKGEGLKNVSEEDTPTDSFPELSDLAEMSVDGIPADSLTNADEA